MRTWVDSTKSACEQRRQRARARDCDIRAAGKRERQGWGIERRREGTALCCVDVRRGGCVQRRQTGGGREAMHTKHRHTHTHTDRQHRQYIRRACIIYLLPVSPWPSSTSGQRGVTAEQPAHERRQAQGPAQGSAQQRACMLPLCPLLSLPLLFALSLCSCFASCASGSCCQRCCASVPRPTDPPETPPRATAAALFPSLPTHAMSKVRNPPSCS
jgi:hypothetical protein